jgi:hypothetical protein
LKERESLRRTESRFERKKSLGALKSDSAHIAMAVQNKPLASNKFSWFACFTTVMGLELFFRFPREKPSLTKKRERERERERRLP